MPAPSTRSLATKTAVAVALLLLTPLALAKPLSTESPGTPLELTDHNGQRRPLPFTNGKVVMLSFGYTSCPDVCPVTLAMVGKVLRDLGPRAKEVQALFVSLDPERDSAERLRRYVQHFHPAILGLSGSHVELRRLGQRFKVTHSRRPGADSENYTLDHTANLYLLDAEGRVARIVPFGFPPQHVSRQVLELLNLHQ